jgi:hypothetical protein
MFIADMTEAFQRVPMSAWVTGGGAGFVAFLAGLAFANGVIKQVVNCLCVGAGVWVMWYAMRHRVDLFGSGAANMGTDRLVIFSSVAGLIAFVVARIGVGALSAFGIFNVFNGMSGWKGMAMSLLPSGFVLWIATMALRLMGNIYGMEGAAALGREGTRITSTFGGWVNDAKRGLEKSSLGSVFLNLDPFAMRPTANLARLLVVWDDKRVWPQLAANPKTGAVFAHPRVAGLGQDAAVRKCIESNDYPGLMQLPQVEKVAQYPDLTPLLSDVGLEDAMDQILYGRAPNKR